MCESIGHQPLWGRCPAPLLNFKHNLHKQGMGTADHLTLLRLFTFLAFLTSFLYFYVGNNLNSSAITPIDI